VSWRVEVDRSSCVSSGVCVGYAPKFFQIRDGASTPVSAVVDEAAEVLTAAEICPVEAITVTDIEAGEKAVATG
jgi:ferredoxin